MSAYTWYGIFAPVGTPRPMLERIEPSVDKLLEHVQEHSSWQVPDAGKGEG